MRTGVGIVKDLLDLLLRIGLVQQLVGDRANHPVAFKAPGNCGGGKRDQDEKIKRGENSFHGSSRWRAGNGAFIARCGCKSQQIREHPS